MAHEDKSELKENLKEEGKKVVKKGAKNFAKRAFMAALPYISIILVVVMLASAVFATLSQVIDSIKGIGQSVVNFFIGRETGIDTESEEFIAQLDIMIEQIEALGIDFEDLGVLRRSKL